MGANLNGARGTTLRLVGAERERTKSAITRAEAAEAAATASAKELAELRTKVAILEATLVIEREARGTIEATLTAERISKEAAQQMAAELQGSLNVEREVRQNLEKREPVVVRQAGPEAPTTKWRLNIHRDGAERAAYIEAVPKAD